MAFTLQATYGGYSVAITGTGANALPPGIVTKTGASPTLVVVSGALTANAVVTFPQGCGNLIVENDTTGAFLLQVNTPTQVSTPPVINQGFRASLCSTPTDLVLAQTDHYDLALPASVTVGVSPFVYKNTSGRRQNIIVTGGTVTTISISRDGVTYYATGLIVGAFLLNPNDYVQVVYTAAPVMTAFPI